MKLLLLLMAAVVALLSGDSSLAGLTMLAGAAVGVCAMIQLVRKGKYLSSLFIVAYLLMYFPNPVLIAFGVLDLESSATTQIFARVNSMHLAGLALFLAGNGLIHAPRDTNHFYIQGPTLELALILIMALGTLGFIVPFVVSGGREALFASREAFKEVYDATSYLRLVGNYLYLPLFVAPLLVTQLPRRRQLWYWTIIITLLIGNFLLFRGRTVIVAFLLATIIGILLKDSGLLITDVRSRLKPRLRHALSIGALALLILVGGVSVRFLRGFVSGGQFRFSADVASVWIENSFSGGDFGYSRTTRAAVQAYPQQADYLGGQSYYRALLVPVPRFIYPDKPENTQREFCRVVNPAMWLRGGTIPPSIIGDLYINFGYLGLMGMLAFGLVFAMERYTRLWHYMVLASSAVWLLHFVRGGFTNPLVTLIFCIVVCRVLERIIKPYYLSAEGPGIPTALPEGQDASHPQMQFSSSHSSV